MKFCPECGTRIEGMKFCPECGFKNTDAAAQPQEAPAQQQPATASQAGASQQPGFCQGQEQTIMTFESKPTATARAIQDVATKADVKGKVGGMKKGLLGKIKPADDIIAKADIDTPAVRYTLTSQRLITDKIGIIGKERSEINLEDVADVTFSQGLSEKMLGHGTVTLKLNDGKEVKLERVENHEAVREAIRTAVFNRKQELTALSNAAYVKSF